METAAKHLLLFTAGKALSELTKGRITKAPTTVAEAKDLALDILQEEGLKLVRNLDVPFLGPDQLGAASDLLTGLRGLSAAKPGLTIPKMTITLPKASGKMSFLNKFYKEGTNISLDGYVNTKTKDFVFNVEVDGSIGFDGGDILNIQATAITISIERKSKKYHTEFTCRGSVSVASMSPVEIAISGHHGYKGTKLVGRAKIAMFGGTGVLHASVERQGVSCAEKDTQEEMKYTQEEMEASY
jgi:hypothetical protein